jgi:uncharacterized repeat protein (TIGR04138 family)
MKELEKIARQDGRFGPQMVSFVYEALGSIAKKKSGGPVHVSGQQLCQALRHLAVERWGRLAMLVLGTGGVRTTRHFGEIVYLLIEHKWMKRQHSESIEDFDDVYGFEDAFKKQFVF